VKPTRLIAILGIAILVVVIVLWQRHENRLRGTDLSHRLGGSAGTPR